MSALMDIWHAIQAIVMSADVITLVIMAVIAIGAGVMMQNMGSVVSTTLVALLAFALVEYVLAITLHKQNAAMAASTDWQSFQDLHMLSLLAYAILFGVVIGLAHTVRSIFNR